MSKKGLPIHSLLINFICLLSALSFVPPSIADKKTSAKPLAATSVTSLNGTWQITPEGLPATTIKVPGFYVTQSVTGRFIIDEDGPDNLWRIFEGMRDAVYQRNFDVGTDMNGGRVFLRFEAVNFACRITVNDTTIMTHYGGFLPFEVDITDHITIPSQNNILSVTIIGNNTRLFFQGLEEFPLWPMGFFGNRMNNGITGGVSLLSRSDLYIEDVSVETSVTDMTLTATVAIRNLGQNTASALCQVRISDPGRTVGSSSFSLEPDSTAVLRFVYAWPDAKLWSPKNPYLFDIVATLFKDNSEINSKTKTTGFREFTQQGASFYLNGNRITLLGDNIVLHGEKRYWRYLIPDPENWSTVVDSLLNLNCNVIRLHQQPAEPWMLDICDEKGMLVIAESAIYAQVADRQEDFIHNARIWQKEWIKRDRHHPSIVLWSASNEMYYPSRHFLADQIYRFGTAITEIDSSRPVFFEGDFNIEGLANIGSYHYIYGFPNGGIPAEGIYHINTFRYDDIPSSHGEFEWSRGLIPESERIRYQCLKSRAMRIGRWADIRPYRLDWAWHPNPDFFESDYGDWHPTAEEIEFLRNTFNPVAVFDSAYYEFNASPISPNYNEYQDICRHIHVFNNESDESPITVRWQITLDGAPTETHEMTVSVPAGGMSEQDIHFHAPGVDEIKKFYLTMSTLKNGAVRFTEDYSFRSIPIPQTSPHTPDNMQIATPPGSIVLSWNAVTTDTNGQPISVDHYHVFRCGNVSFDPAQTDTFTVGNNAFSDNEPVKTPASFYRVCAVDSIGRPSEKSAIVGFLTFQLFTGKNTHYNTLSVPFEAPATSPGELLPTIPLCTEFAIWDFDLQAFTQYMPDTQGSDFPVSHGGPFLAHITDDTSWTVSGAVSTMDYQIPAKGNSTGFSLITLPFSKYTLAKASSILEDIPGCESVACWSAVTQEYLQYLPGYPATDFDVIPGHPYFITVTDPTIWPAGHAGKIQQNPPSAPGTTDLSPPHTAIVPTDIFFNYHENITIKAWLNDDTTAYIMSTMTRAIPRDTVLMIQCAAFDSGWEPADSLTVMFGDENGACIGYAKGELTCNAWDRLYPIYETGVSDKTDVSYLLSQNYPNPFNAGTSIAFSVPSRMSVTVNIYNLAGRVIRTLCKRLYEPGSYILYWDGRDSQGHLTSSGIYICSITSGHTQKAIRMLQLK